ncbi:MAG: deoxyribodipyrimidine photo-lyase [Saprospiraceae bacterium]|jgi:deoxyribodipyrimidine photo-lyase
MDKISIFWFRRDLRLDDNVGLFHALTTQVKVLPIFIFDTSILSELEKEDARVTFLYKQLKNINAELSSIGSSLKVYFGKPLEVFTEIIKTFNVDTVYTNRDYEPYAIKRDESMGRFLQTNDIAFKTYKDQVIFETDDILKQDATPYTIYTPYSKKWLAVLEAKHYSSISSEVYLENFLKIPVDFPTLEAIGFTESSIEVLPFDLSKNLIDNYEATRNYPELNKTSKLSPHLRFGTISVRKCVQQALQSRNYTFLKELIWREFFMQILWHFPGSAINNFKRKYDSLHWRNKETEFEAWCTGNTGYPLVDAGMRELNATGYMHNRVRMITASFLCKHLLIDWRWGEAYFAKKLLDFDLAQNVGNWQWSAGTGCDATPYFRIFNPTTQVEKFDKNLQYIKKWVPEFQEANYPKPIVDHKKARERCLSVYKEAIN